MFTYEEIQEAIENKELIVLKNVFTDTPGWAQFIAHLNFEFYNNTYPPSKPDDPVNEEDTIINGVNIREKFYLMNCNGEDPRFFPEAAEVRKQLNSVMDSNPMGSFALINFVGKEKAINIHFDPRHSFYWQTEGTSSWEIYEEKVGENGFTLTQTVDVEDGDIIFVPHGVWHSVFAAEPRTAISFMYEI